MEKKRLRLDRHTTLEGEPLAQVLEKFMAYQEYLSRFEKRGLASDILKLILQHGLVDKEGLRQEGLLRKLAGILEAKGRWQVSLEPDEEHTAFALHLSPTASDAAPMRLDWELLSGSDFQALVRLDHSLAEFKTPPHLVEDKTRSWKFNSLEDLIGFILEEGQRGIAVQRFKGLGEMNPEQLWETTMDPESRTLLKVKVEDAAEADYIFTTLMGDKVEPRREFIQNNVLELNELDI